MEATRSTRSMRALATGSAEAQPQPQSQHQPLGRMARCWWRSQPRSLSQGVAAIRMVIQRQLSSNAEGRGHGEVPRAQRNGAAWSSVPITTVFPSLGAWKDEGCGPQCPPGAPVRPCHTPGPGGLSAPAAAQHAAGQSGDGDVGHSLSHSNAGPNSFPLVTHPNERLLAPSPISCPPSIPNKQLPRLPPLGVQAAILHWRVELVGLGVGTFGHRGAAELEAKMDLVHQWIKPSAPGLSQSQPYCFGCYFEVVGMGFCAALSK